MPNHLTNTPRTIYKKQSRLTPAGSDGLGGRLVMNEQSLKPSMICLITVVICLPSPNRA